MVSSQTLAEVSYAAMEERHFGGADQADVAAGLSIFQDDAIAAHSF